MVGDVSGDDRDSSRVPHNRLTYGEEEIRAVSDVIRSGQWTCGPKVGELERALAERARVAHAVAVGSGLSALTLSLRGLGVSEGDEVIIPAYSFVALPNAVMACGAKVVLVDVRDSDWNLDPKLVRDAVTPSTKAIIVVNTFGAPAPIEELSDLGIPVIEDCAHGFGWDARGGIMGGRSEAAILSLHATKPIGAGEGGAVLTDNSTLAQYVRKLRDYDELPAGPTRHNDVMTDIEAALALAQLQRYYTMMQEREQLALRYDEVLTPVERRTGAFKLPAPACDRVWYRYAIEMTNLSTQETIDALRRYGVHAIRPVKDWRQQNMQLCPVADRAYQHIVSLPLYPTLQHKEQDRVCRALQAVAGGS